MSEVSIILGVMSGTSLDGVDLALCKFSNIQNVYQFEIIKSKCVSYSKEIKKKLSDAHLLSTSEFLKFHKTYGSYLGKEINVFLRETQKPEYIASHGHTIFHDPSGKFTFQIGDGAFIAAEAGIPVISDFRNLDTALNGQGAPLVPIGDKYLFSDYDYCINLGGFANISFDLKDERIAFDICPVNIILNKFAKNIGFEYDKDGLLGMEGEINFDLLNELNNITYYNLKYPKSLAREYVESEFLPILNKYQISEYDKIRTFYEHITVQILKVIQPETNMQVLLTGGGAHNCFLIKEIKKRTNHNIMIPDKETIDFKEALIFAFLGYLRINNKINTLSSVTGARYDSVGGNVYFFRK